MYALRVLILLELLGADDFEGSLNSFTSIIVRVVHQGSDQEWFQALKLVDFFQEEARLPYDAGQEKIKWVL